jgi:hypothetical protein
MFLPSATSQTFLKGVRNQPVPPFYLGAKFMQESFKNLPQSSFLPIDEKKFDRLKAKLIKELNCTHQGRTMQTGVVERNDAHSWQLKNTLQVAAREALMAKVTP